MNAVIIRVAFVESAVGRIKSLFHLICKCKVKYEAGRSRDVKDYCIYYACVSESVSFEITVSGELIRKEKQNKTKTCYAAAL